MIKLNNISKSYDGKTFVVKNVSLEIKEGETLVLLGSSGCGKTTVLKMINRIIESTSGTIEIDHQDITSVNKVTLRRKIGYAFQRIGLFPHMTVEENITVVMRLEKQEKSLCHARARELLSMVNMDPDTYLQRFPDELSGGQAQRVGVARALANEPKYLLMDEPFGALDALTRESMQGELLSLQAKLNKTIVFVTHDIFEALKLGDRIAVMNKGHIEQIGTKHDILNQPSTDFVRELLRTPQQQIKEFAEHLE